MRITLAAKAAIEARLLNAPEQGRYARMKVSGGLQLTGLVGPADAEARLPMVLDDSCPESLGAGSPAHVTLQAGADAFAFYTNVIEVTEAGHLLLRFPASIQVQEHREEARETLQSSEQVLIELSDGQRSLSFPVLDMSKTGLSFRFTTGTVLLRTRETFTARVMTRHVDPYLANFEVRNVRSDPQSGGCRIAGVKVVGPPPDLLSWLRQARRLLHDAARGRISLSG